VKKITFTTGSAEIEDHELVVVGHGTVAEARIEVGTTTCRFDSLTG